MTGSVGEFIFVSQTRGITSIGDGYQIEDISSCQSISFARTGGGSIEV